MITVSYSGDRELKAWINTRASVVDRNVKRAVESGIKIIALDVSRMTPRSAAVSGNPTRPHLADDWKTMVEDGGWVVRGYVYAGESQPDGKVGAIEFGRAAGPAPVSAIYPWVVGALGGNMQDARNMAKWMRPQPPRQPMMLGLAAASDTVMSMVRSSFFDAFGV